MFPNAVPSNLPDSLPRQPLENPVLSGGESRWHVWRAAGLALGVVVCLGLVWLAGNLWGLSYQIGGQRVRAGASTSEVAQAITWQAASYKIRVQYPGGATKAFPLSVTGLSVDAAASAQAGNRSLTLTDRLMWWRPVPIALALKTDQPRLANFIAQNLTVVTAKPTDASISLGNGTLSLTDAVAGKQYGLTDAPAALGGRARTLDARPLVLAAMPVNPALTRDRLATAAGMAKRVLDERITVTIGTHSVTPAKTDISAWLSLVPRDDAQDGKTVDVTVNSAAVHTYIAGLAAKYSQLERDQVVVNLADGTSTVAVSGQDGVAVAGQQAAEDAIAKSLLNGADFSVALAASSKPFHTVSAGNWPKWIEVNLTTKRLYAYEYDRTVQTYLVSAGKPSTPTPTGTFYIWNKLTSQTMYGPGYVQPNVPWVNYFDHSGDAIHGVYWRPASVFGAVNTSHGCVGLQQSDAVWVYRWADAGTPVVIHG